MSSNIRLTKLCEHCNKEFIAKTIQTRYCSHSCNNKAYKEAKRKEKLESVSRKGNIANPPNPQSLPINYSGLNQKEFLTINECSLLLNITSVTLRRWIKDQVISTKRVGKKHIIKRQSINDLLS
jgi:excisionase family DNA binding protein